MDQTTEPTASSSTDRRRQAMPTVAQFIDQCRAMYDGQFVDLDAAMATAQKARREHADVLDQQGAQAARQWLKTNAKRCTFYAAEGGRVVGLASPWGAAASAGPAGGEAGPPPARQQVTPPIGTPPAPSRRGNSPPARAPVVGGGQSEQVGGQTGRSPADLALQGGVHRG
ncbi:hypothetical protein [Hydrogenophaga sp.]|uniref:hypothetical protein n=1 Tax=Hydrogenophaga sp. TaxID=1904254 RepID=UPI00271C3F85|nr:hypothetical protein [Hydrogenophaga sp.]MDO8903981.1 hypothetical protein [Hydrogenophaga sp.]